MNKRISAWFLIVLCLFLSIYSGSRLLQAIDGERDLKGQIADLSAARNNTLNSPVGGDVTRGVASLSNALSEVQGSATSDELALAAEGIVLLAGVSLLRFRSGRSMERPSIPPQSLPATRT